MSNQAEERISVETMTPTQIVSELDKYIVGQRDAKKAVAIAIRNRVRRQRVEEKEFDVAQPMYSRISPLNGDPTKNVYDFAPSSPASEQYQVSPNVSNQYTTPPAPIDQSSPYSY